jgi:tetratricopeptide (TPR) repeat protein
MSLKDIEKLKERVDKDPNTKLFVPLAEEYKKEGMLDEAISVLLGGIERQPGYMSARVSLGKIYLEKGMMNEARSEFENVIKSIPDNLYAHKKLAEIYRDLGEKTLSMRSYRAVLSLNALDDDAISHLRDLEENEGEKEQVETAHEVKGAPDTAVPPRSYGDISVPKAEKIEPVPEITLPQHTDEELNAFKDSIFGDKSAEAVEVVETDSDVGEEDTIEIVEDDAAGEEISFEDISEAVLVDVPHPADTSADTGETKPEARRWEEEKAESVSPGPLAGGTRSEAADGLIAAGNYFGAMNAYRKMLSADPNDRAVLQRVEELKGLLKLMGKDQEALISKLDDFLKGIQKRRDEFHRSS